MHSHYSLPGDKNGRLSGKERTEGVRGVVNDLTVGERTVGSWVDDVIISSKIKSKLIANSEIKAGDIDVSCSQGVVTLPVASAPKQSMAPRNASRAAPGASRTCTTSPWSAGWGTRLGGTGGL